MSGEVKKIRIPALTAMKAEGRKIVMLTAFDALTGAWADAAGVDIVLVGDSLGRSALGLRREIQVTMEAMIHHCAAVARGARRAFRVGDMPFMSYKISAEQALENAARMIQAGDMEAVKLEGGAEIAPHVARLTQAGLPVMGHIGLLPQSFHAQGGYRIQGKTETEAKRLIRDAKSLEEAGVFSLVLEGIPHELAGRITSEMRVPTIGIGAGKACDGQVLVISDLLGLTGGAPPKLARQYVNLSDQATQAIARYADEARRGDFPGAENVYE